MSGRSPSIKVAGATKSFASAVETVWAVRDVSFTAYPGDLVCLHGASGSGKTTLLRLLAGLSSADCGSIQVGQQSVGDLDERERATLRRETVGVVFQDHRLIDEFSAAENVALALEIAGKQTRDALDQARSVLEQVGLGGLEKRFPAQLSGGPRQRVGIARALVGGSLDSRTSAGVFELIRSLCDQGLSAVVCTHDPQCRRYADQVFEMVDGQLTDTNHYVDAIGAG